MTSQQEMPFASVLEALFSAEDLPISLLYRLSDLSDADFERFKRGWSAVDEDRRVAIARHMSEIVEESYLLDFSPVFAYMFSDESAAVRVAALDGLWDSEEQSLIPMILDLLATDKDHSVRAAAARALAHYILLAEWGQISNSYTDKIVDGLLAAYDDPRSPLDVKRATLEAVSASAHPRVPVMITDAYEEGSNDLQLSAIFAMGVSADERWLPMLEQELHSPSPDFRAEAARACGIIGGHSSIEALEQLINDEDQEVGMAAILALGQIGGDRVFALLSHLAEDPNYEDYYEVIEDALDELEWMDSSFDMLAFPDEENHDDDEDDILDQLRLN
ncbi:MAG TPA: HEAT repeat domain-containing protein [Promineifilum sp.]|nr:HEAT repeat domain-containing protein [Promineifilum sp.]HRO90419.1 HEAT repeat domain-containing protein [Promineifilum sp.]HRQ13401.1 HEAT repeat domain-containing protein [Promineifilum sp.]